MDRFTGEPTEPKVLRYCEQCDSPLYDGETAYENDDGWFCDVDCVLDFYGVKLMEVE